MPLCWAAVRERCGGRTAERVTQSPAASRAELRRLRGGLDYTRERIVVRDAVASDWFPDYPEGKEVA